MTEEDFPVSKNSEAHSHIPGFLGVSGEGCFGHGAFGAETHLVNLLYFLFSWTQGMAGLLP